MHTRQWSTGYLAHVLYIAIAVLLGLYMGSQWYHLMPWYSPSIKAVAVLRPTEGNSAEGLVTFSKTDNGVQVSVNCKNVKPGKHGFHIHEHGDCGCPDAKCAGEHFNPTHTKHGSLTSKERHVGDFGNLEANTEGVITAEFIAPNISLNGPKSIVGRSIILHADEDDLTSQPSGNSGARIACGTIGCIEK